MIWLIIVILIVLIITIITILICNKMTSYKYLNYNSTYLKGGKFNPSDVAYAESLDLKLKENQIKAYISQYVNAPENAKIIFNSGATESIANLIFWAKEYNRYGKIQGSILDHPSVKENAKNYGVGYTQYSYNDLNKDQIEIDDGTSMLFISGVGPSTGEIYPMNKFKKYVYMSQYEDDEPNQNMRQYPFIKVLDASQMIGKIPIDMVNNELNAVFFSLHKIGGEFNTGILIIDDSNIYTKFKPIIAGTQQNHLRGGTYNTYAYLDLPNLLQKYESKYNPEKCKKQFNKIIKELKKHNINYHKPQLPTLNNTVLIHLNECNAGIINNLSEYGIYLGSSTACETNNINTDLRISYLTGDELNDKTIKFICDEIDDIDNVDVDNVDVDNIDVDNIDNDDD